MVAVVNKNQIENLPFARFDEEGLVKLTMEWLLRHRQTKGAGTDKQFLMAIESQSFTLPRIEKIADEFDIVLFSGLVMCVSPVSDS